MNLQELYSSIGLQPEIVRRLERLEDSMDLSPYEPFLAQMGRRETAAQAYRALDACLPDDPDHLAMLYCQLECARRIYARYQEMHIPGAIFTDTMKCFSRFIGECGRRNGRLFFDRGWWSYRQVSMCLFRIGALEYEFTEHAGKNVVSIHIPSDADLSQGSVDGSLEQAASFFREYYPDHSRDAYICESWLLSSALRPFLSEGSHILSFQRRFSILQEDREGEDCLEWLFQVPKDIPLEDLPQRTGLQQKVRAFLLDGGKIGGALGIMEQTDPSSLPPSAP